MEVMRRKNDATPRTRPELVKVWALSAIRADFIATVNIWNFMREYNSVLSKKKKKNHIAGLLACLLLTSYTVFYRDIISVEWAKPWM